MIDWRVSIRAGGRLALGLVVVHDVIAPRGAGAQAMFRVSPTLTAAQVHESNLFSTPSDRQGDYVIRITPGIRSEYRTPLWTVFGRGAFDLERFAAHAELSGLDARQHALGRFEYRPTRRTGVSAEGEFSRTHRPGELSTQTGLMLTRSTAQRIGAHASVVHHVNPVTARTVEYTFTDERLAGASEIRTHDATLGTNHRVSSRDVLDAGYRVRRFLFGTSSATSQALRLGWTRAMSRDVRLSIEGGPNLTAGAPALDLEISIREDSPSRNLTFSYMRTQTTVFGLPGIVDTQRLNAIIAWRPRRSLVVNVAPTFYRSQQSSTQADVYRLRVGGMHPIARGLSLEIAFDGSLQHGNVYRTLANETISRHEVLIGLMAGSASDWR